jgi:hypothetical protein
LHGLTHLAIRRFTNGIKRPLDLLSPLGIHRDQRAIQLPAEQRRHLIDPVARLNGKRSAHLVERMVHLLPGCLPGFLCDLLLRVGDQERE